MALSFDDKILGEKVDNYCSSSEDEDESGQPKFEKVNKDGSTAVEAAAASAANGTDSSRFYNTGPKGVIEDWRRYKQLENEKREEQRLERHTLAKKLTLTCKSALDEEKERTEEDELERQLNEEWQKFEDDEFLKEYQRKRLEEMKMALFSLPRFGHVVELTDPQAYIAAVDCEPESVTVVIHVYADSMEPCRILNGCLISLAKKFTIVKFCKVRADLVKMSQKFQEMGVPALLVYKKRQMIGNFVRVHSNFPAPNFFAHDVESFLYEHGLLPSDEDVRVIQEFDEEQNRIKEDGGASDHSGDSDFDVD